MTLSINGNEIGQAVEIGITVLSIVAMIIGAFLVWLMVRPSKRVPPPPRVRDLEDVELEHMMRTLDRMEERLAVLERAIGRDDEAPRRLSERNDDLLQAGEESPERGRTK